MSLRILMTLDAVGGVWRYAVDLGAALAEAGHEVIFAGLGPAPDAAAAHEAGRAGVVEWGDAPLDWMADGPEALAPVPRWLNGLVAKHRPDLLHLNLPSQALGLENPPPILAVTHSCLATWFRAVERRSVPGAMAWQAHITAAGLRAADRTLAPSAAHAALTAKVHALAPPAAVPNASRASLHAPDAGDGTVVAAARWWDKAKNGATLDAAAALSGLPVQMLGACAGPGGNRFAPAHATAPGALPHAEVTARIAASSLFVSPSLYEPFGLAALEAARAGRPLLLADIPVYRELWKGAAQFFDPRSPHDLARRMQMLMHAPAERRALAEAAQRRARRYTLPAQAARMTDIYQEITAARAVSAAP